MKKKITFTIYLLLLMFILVGCSDKQVENISLEIWHYYNSTQKITLDELVEEFNETVGLEKGIIVEAFSQGGISQLDEKVMESVDNKVGSSELPNMVTAYPEVAYKLDEQGIIANLEDYIRDEELGEYIDSYIEEGRLGKDNQFKIFPTAKSTEVMMVNKTDWDKFAKDSGAKIEDLATWEGVRKTAELYYDWTGGKAFFGRNTLANYMLVGSKQLGEEIFQINEDEVLVNLDPDIMRRLWDNYYIPYISGYYTSYGRFSTDDAKIGEIIALVGSTTGAPYFPDNVTIGDEDPYDIDLLVLPVPNFENTSLNVVQQGAGITVIKSGQAQEQASVEFLKWFTQESRNLEFAIKTGYLPVKKESYNMKKLEELLEEKTKEGLSKQLLLTMPLAMAQVGEYELSVTKGFKQEENPRLVLESSLEGKAKEDRQKVVELIDQGISHEDAVQRFSTDENFKDWLFQLEDSIRGAVGQ